MTTRTPKLTRLAVALLLTGAIITFSALRSGPIRAFAADAGDGNRCGARGTYGYTAFGNTFAGNALGFPVGIASTNGTITLDGKGNTLIHEVEVIEGNVVSPPGGSTFVGTITLNPDCSFTATLPGLTGPVFVGVVVDHGKQIGAMSTLPGVQLNYVSTVRVDPENSSE